MNTYPFAVIRTTQDNPWVFLVGFFTSEFRRA